MINEGDLVFLYKDEKRNFLMKVQGGRLHTDFGFIELKDIIGKEFGQKIDTSLGHPFYILRPYLYEMIMKIKYSRILNNRRTTKSNMQCEIMLIQ